MFPRSRQEGVGQGLSETNPAGSMISRSQSHEGSSADGAISSDDVSGDEFVFEEVGDEFGSPDEDEGTLDLLIHNTSPYHGGHRQ